MKRCPKCSRTFPDDNQKFCTIDGGLLLTADKPFDPNATIQSSSVNPVSPVEPPKEQTDFSATIATSSSAPTVMFPTDTGPTGTTTDANLHQRTQQAQTSPSATAPPPAAEPPPVQKSVPPPPALSAPQPQAQRVPLPPVASAPVKKKSKLPLILGILAILLILGIGGVVAAFFLVVKPRLDQLNSRRPVVARETQPENVNNNSNVNTSSSQAKPEESEFVAPPDTTKFTNSKANLAPKLAAQYLDFSFYYPNNWVVDPKAGTVESGNFAKVERRLPPDFTQENFAVRSYQSKGTYTSDLPNYPTQVEEFSSSLAKFFPEYRKVSEGPTKINSLDAYEFRWEAASKGTVKGDLKLWGRVVFVPTGVEGDKTGAILTMFTTSLAPELSGVEDVGEKGQMPVILESFRLAKGRS
jgi:hypothetical protein